MIFILKIHGESFHYKNALEIIFYNNNVLEMILL